MQKIYRHWGADVRTPNPIQVSHLSEEAVASIAEMFPYAHYFFVEED